MNDDDDDDDDAWRSASSYEKMRRIDDAIARAIQPARDAIADSSRAGLPFYWGGPLCGGQPSIAAVPDERRIPVAILVRSDATGVYELVIAAMNARYEWRAKKRDT